MRVLASGSIAAAYGAASMCPHAEKRPARARQRSLFPLRTSKMSRTSLKQNDLYEFTKRLGDICGLVSCQAHPPSHRPQPDRRHRRRDGTKRDMRRLPDDNAPSERPGTCQHPNARTGKNGQVSP